VLDGFVIEGKDIEQAPIKEAKGKPPVLKRHFLAISVSVIVHLILALLLFFISEKHQPKQVKITSKAIKSYLYKMPPKPVIDVPKAIQEPPEKIIAKEEIKTELKPKVLQQESANKAEVIKETPLKMNEVSEASSLEKPSQKAVQATFSSYKQLDSLRDSINKKIIEQGVSEYQQFRSPSVMHADQIPVPHSTLQLTPEQEREKKTTKMSDDISITKYDNGLCTIERKQFLGSPVEGSTSAFACGESKFDKSFRDHMKKVRDKIMPETNK